VKPHRITALMVRHVYLYGRSVPRMLEVLYWPFLDLTVWGFITLYLAKHHTEVPAYVTFLLGALILWDMLFRSQQAVTLAFLEEMWAKNLINLFASPLKPSEFLAAAMVISILKVLIVSLVMIMCAMVFFSYNLLLMGLWLVPFILNLVVMGWVIGVLTTSLVMRFGHEVAVLASSLVFIFQPISCVFYPLEALPHWLQPLAHINPASHIFEGMRAVLGGAASPGPHLAWATMLNLILLVGVIAWFFRMFAFCQKQGLLVRVGE
jgi:ABC-2 type transport system permease protein